MRERLMGPVLEEILYYKRQEIAGCYARLPLAKLEKTVEALSQPLFEQALAGKELKLILEIKPASPSEGILREELSEPEQLKRFLSPVLDVYNAYGSALSVLTDQRFFGGSLDLLKAVLAETSLPVLRKEFVLDHYQVLETRAAWAHAVLLIVKAFAKDKPQEQAQLKSLYRLIKDLGMTAVVEIADEWELERALALNPTTVMVNNRDLNTLAIDMNSSLRLLPQVPENILTLAASGYTNIKDLTALSPVCRRFLVGSALMKLPADAMAETLSEWQEALK